MRLRDMITLKTAEKFKLSLVLGSAIVLASCSGDGRPLEEAVETNQLNLVRNGLAIVQPTGLLNPLFVNPGEQINFSILATNSAGESLPLSVADRRWSVSNPAVASIDGNGKFIGIADGFVQVGLQIGGLTAEFDVTVAEGTLTAINVIEEDPMEGESSLERCLPEMYRATGTFTHTFSGEPATSSRGLVNVDWSVNDPEMGSATAQLNGTTSVTAFNAGELELTATVGNLSDTEPLTVSSTLDRIEISPALLTVMAGSDLQVFANGFYLRGDEETPTPIDITQSVNWSLPTDNGFATVSNVAPTKGLVAGIAEGNPEITAACGDDIQAVGTIVVQADDGSVSTELAFDGGRNQRISLSQGTRQLRVSTGSEYDEDNDVTDDDDTTWTVVAGTEFAAFQSFDEGVITPLEPGTATIRVEVGDDQAFLILTVVQ